MGLFFENYCQKTIEIENAPLIIILEMTMWNIFGIERATICIEINPFSCDEICGSIYASSSFLCKCGELSNVIDTSCESSPNEIVGLGISLEGLVFA